MEFFITSVRCALSDFDFSLEIVPEMFEKSFQHFYKDSVVMCFCEKINSKRKYCDGEASILSTS